MSTLIYYLIESTAFSVCDCRETRYVPPSRLWKVTGSQFGSGIDQTGTCHKSCSKIWGVESSSNQPERVYQLSSSFHKAGSDKSSGLSSEAVHKSSVLFFLDAHAMWTPQLGTRILVWWQRATIGSHCEIVQHTMSSWTSSSPKKMYLRWSLTERIHMQGAWWGFRSLVAQQIANVVAVFSSSAVQCSSQCFIFLHTVQTVMISWLLWNYLGASSICHTFSLSLGLQEWKLRPVPPRAALNNVTKRERHYDIFFACCLFSSTQMVIFLGGKALALPEVFVDVLM